MSMYAFVALVKDYGLLSDLGLNDDGITAFAEDSYEKECFDSPNRKGSVYNIDRIMGSLG